MKAEYAQTISELDQVLGMVRQPGMAETSNPVLTPEQVDQIENGPWAAECYDDSLPGF